MNKPYNNQRLLILGDLVVDHYVWGKADRLSQEAPVPIIRVERKEDRLGNAGNVARQCRAFGASVSVVGVVGEDREGDILSHLFLQEDILYNVIIDRTRPTTVKTRIMAGHHQVVRVDEEETEKINVDTEQQILSVLDTLFHQRQDIDGVILCDIGKGVVTPTICQFIDNHARCPVLVDPKRSASWPYCRPTLLTPSREELLVITGLADPYLAIYRLAEQYPTTHILSTLGEDGMICLPAKTTMIYDIPAHVAELYDVTGAGDTVIAVCSMELLAGRSIYQAAVMANQAAGMAVRRVGTAIIQDDELMAVKEHPDGGYTTTI